MSRRPVVTLSVAQQTTRLAAVLTVGVDTDAKRSVEESHEAEGNKQMRVVSRYDKNGNIPELPDELYDLISKMTIQCIQASVFQMSWVKQNKILQVVVSLSPTNVVDAFDLDRVGDLLRPKLQQTFPQALPFSIDRINMPANNLALRFAVSEFVSQISYDFFRETSQRITNEIASELVFRIENNNFISMGNSTPTWVSNFSICRRLSRSTPSKAWNMI